jgi:L-Ala-D/L-Glu epimerase
MKITRTEVAQYRVPLRIPFVTAWGTIAERNGILIKAECDNGITGYGEIAPLEGYSLETLPQVRGAALTISRRLVGLEVPGSPESLGTSYVGRQADRDESPGVVFGVETLLADLASQVAGKSMSKWLNPNASFSVPVNAVLSGSLEEIKSQLVQKESGNYPAWKLKIGVESPNLELRKIAWLRERISKGCSIRLDANQSLTFSQATAFLDSASKFNIEYIEEPLRVDQQDRLPELRERSGVRIALDESLAFSGLESEPLGICQRALAMAEKRMLDVMIIKSMLVGGFADVIRLVESLRRLGVDSVITTALEAGIGVTASLHLAAALGRNLLPCGLDTLGLLSDSLIEETPRVADGCLAIPGLPGLGQAIRDWDHNPRIQVIR